jgi:porin
MQIETMTTSQDRVGLDGRVRRKFCQVIVALTRLRTLAARSFVAFLFALNVVESAAAQEHDGKLVASASTSAESASFLDKFWTDPNLTGNWGGLRDDWAEDGFTVDLTATHVTQSVVSGGNQKPGPLIAPIIEDETGSGVSLDLVLQLDTGKADLWPGGFFKVRGEARFGDSVTYRAGTISPVNADAIFPLADVNDTVVDLTEFTFTQFLSPQFGVFGGLINTYDSDLNPFAGSTRGQAQFLNLAFQLNPATFTGAPYKTMGGGAVFIPTPEVLFVGSVVNTEDSSDDNPLEATSGITHAGELYFSHELFGRPSGQMLGYVLGWDEFGAIDDPRILLPPDSPFTPDTKDFTWALYYNAYHYLEVYEPVQRWSPLAPATPPGGWGLFIRAGLSDGNPNPVNWFVSGGIGGNVPFRHQDTFGIGLYYQEMSDETVLRLLGVEDEVGFEAWYSDTPVILGVRTNVKF